MTLCRATLVAVGIMIWIAGSASAAVTNGERWVVLSVQGVPRTLVPASAMQVTLITPSNMAMPYIASGSYVYVSSDFTPLFNAIVGTPYMNFSGTHAMQRQVYSSTTEYVTFLSPLGRLGSGRTSPSGGTVTFSPRSGVTVVFSRLKTQSPYVPPRLWSTATSEIQATAMPVTSDAAESLAAFVGDADDVLEVNQASATEYLVASAYTRALVDEVTANARAKGRAIIMREDVEKAKPKFCPVYPFCKKTK